MRNEEVRLAVGLAFVVFAVFMAAVIMFGGTYFLDQFVGCDK